ncbi:hypothetical protein AA957_29405 [Pseudomonas trivialis]|uniref:Uncharacterized protein n=1 Tax=Pseudomonas trivialis TaxID=200450 RepID=A0A0H5A1H3_9PSED|nr:hypothetical protein AA957_00055 [Pseudomonas trivialis]AKS04586.1 hypothetical protein AA957_00100 [Pseudomonas trivialis]AKS10054.1 hypothetical protein AA957_29405 [Pseudomonas trivialis]
MLTNAFSKLGIKNVNILNEDINIPTHFANQNKQIKKIATTTFVVIMRVQPQCGLIKHNNAKLRFVIKI